MKRQDQDLLAEAYVSIYEQAESKFLQVTFTPYGEVAETQWVDAASFDQLVSKAKEMSRNTSGAGDDVSSAGAIYAEDGKGIEVNFVKKEATDDFGSAPSPKENSIAWYDARYVKVPPALDVANPANKARIEDAVYDVMGSIRELS